VCKYKQGALCTKMKANVPNSWCVTVCQNGINIDQILKDMTRPKPKAKTKAKRQAKGPTKTQMIIHFSKAMTKWVRAGVPIVSKETYLKRRMLCAECHDGKTCPVCGCQLWAKAALETEKCPNGLW